MASKRREDKRTRPVYRTERIVEDGGKWYFYTREGSVEGPFDGKLEAEIQVENYIKVINSGMLDEDEKFQLPSKAFVRWK